MTTAATATYRQLYRPGRGLPAWLWRVWAWF